MAYCFYDEDHNLVTALNYQYVEEIALAKMLSQWVKYAKSKEVIK